MRSVPTFQTTPLNRAKNASEARYPHLWKNQIVAWSPGLGATGSILHDISGNGRNGTLNNLDLGSDWILSDGRVALDFDGIDKYVQGPLIDLAGLPALSVSVWLNWNGDLAPNNKAFIGNFQAGTKAIFQMRMTGSQTLQVFVQGTGGLINGTFSDIVLPSESWHHLAFVYDSVAGMSACFDGVLSTDTFAANGILDPTPSEHTFDIGRDARDSGYWPGSIDDSIVWGRAVLPSENQLLNQLGRGGWMARRRRVFAKALVAPPEEELIIGPWERSWNPGIMQPAWR